MPALRSRFEAIVDLFPWVLPNLVWPQESTRVANRFEPLLLFVNAVGRQP